MRSGETRRAASSGETQPRSADYRPSPEHPAATPCGDERRHEPHTWRGIAKLEVGTKYGTDWRCPGVSAAHTAPESGYQEGDRCGMCGYWWWARDGVGWHSLVSITYADHQELARMVECPHCQEVHRGE